jgi:hypothetical protein
MLSIPLIFLPIGGSDFEAEFQGRLGPVFITPLPMPFRVVFPWQQDTKKCVNSETTQTTVSKGMR